MLVFLQCAKDAPMVVFMLTSIGILVLCLVAAIRIISQDVCLYGVFNRQGDGLSDV